MNGVTQVEGVVANSEVVLKPERWQHHAITYGKRESQFIDLLLHLRLHVDGGFHVGHVGHGRAGRHGRRGVARNRGVGVVHLVHLVLKHRQTNCC